MANVQSSLRAELARLLPSYANPRANKAEYNRTAFQARMSAGVAPPAAENFIQGNDARVLVFSQDYPHYFDVRAFYPTADAPLALPLYDCWCLDSQWIYTAAIAATILTPDAAVEPGEQVTGVTVTNGVRVAGYLGTVNVPDTNLTNAAVPVTVQLIANVITDGAVIHGPPWMFATEDGEGNTITYEAIILQESDYTQAIRNAGDIITHTVGANVAYYEVVGLYTEEAPA